MAREESRPVLQGAWRARKEGEAGALAKAQEAQKAGLEAGQESQAGNEGLAGQEGLEAGQEGQAGQATT